MKKIIYQQPTLIKMGKIIKETQGKNGSSADGNGSLTQSGGGNDGN